MRDPDGEYKVVRDSAWITALAAIYSPEASLAWTDLLARNFESARFDVEAEKNVTPKDGGFAWTTRTRATWPTDPSKPKEDEWVIASGWEKTKQAAEQAATAEEDRATATHHRTQRFLQDLSTYIQERNPV